MFALSRGNEEFGVESSCPWFIMSYNGILVHVRTSVGLRRCGGKTYNVST